MSSHDLSDGSLYHVKYGDGTVSDEEDYGDPWVQDTEIADLLYIRTIEDARRYLFSLLEGSTVDERIYVGNMYFSRSNLDHSPVRQV